MINHNYVKLKQRIIRGGEKPGIGKSDGELVRRITVLIIEERNDYTTNYKEIAFAVAKLLYSCVGRDVAQYLIFEGIKNLAGKYKEQKIVNNK